MGNLIGQSVKRVEDRRFITGKGRYTDDIVLPHMTHACIIRSPHAHARIRGIDATAALAAPGAVAVFTGADLQAEGIVGAPCGWQVDFKNGDTMKEPPHPILAVDKVRHMGDAVAVVIAETAAQARDAAERVAVDYEVLPAVTDVRAALAPGAPLVHDDVPGNVPFDWQLGDKEKTTPPLRRPPTSPRSPFATSVSSPMPSSPGPPSATMTRPATITRSTPAPRIRTSSAC